jgi:hypothetical protein
MSAARTHYEAVLSDLMKRREEIDRAIVTVREAMPQEALPEPPSAPLPAPNTDRQTRSGGQASKAISKPRGPRPKPGGSRKEKVKRVKKALSDPALREKSDTAVAELLKVSRPFVARIRKELGEATAL